MLSLNRAIVLALVAGSLNLAAVGPARARSPIDAGYGLPCSFTSVRDPLLLDDEIRLAEVNGGPIVASHPGATIALTCTIQVGAANSTHAGADTCEVHSATSLQVTVLAPTVCRALDRPFQVPEGQPVYICTQITVNGLTSYWDNGTSGPLGPWSTSSAARCAEAFVQEILPGPLAPALDLVLPIVRPLIPPADFLVQLVLEALLPLAVIVCPILGC